jgi:hypothetical protein
MNKDRVIELAVAAAKEHPEYSEDDGIPEGEELAFFVRFYELAIQDYIKRIGEPVAYMYPDDLERMKTSETFATVFSVKCGSPTQGTTDVSLVVLPKD